MAKAKRRSGHCRKSEVMLTSASARMEHDRSERDYSDECGLAGAYR
jgi:hypothetical protein